MKFFKTAICVIGMTFIFIMSVGALENRTTLTIEGFNHEWNSFVLSNNLDRSSVGDEDYRDTEFSMIEKWDLQQYSRRRNSIPGMDDRDVRWVPYVENKISLVDGTEMSASLINFNWNAPDHYHTFIASHAPLQSNVDLFWKMIWENEIEQIVMVTEITDNGVKQLCYPYLPDSVGDTLELDFGYVVQCIEENWLLMGQAESIQIRKFKVSYDGQERMLTHYWYHNWPDQTAPQQTLTIMTLIQAVFRDKQALNSSSPILAHCAGGVGRTGTFITAYHLFEKAENKEALPTVFELVSQLRWQRPKMVSKPAQYQFCYRIHDELAF